MATQTDPSARPRTPLSRERVVHAALSLADASGIEALSMRKLGQELDVEAMSLYNHVANKEEILDGIVDLVFGEIALPAGEAEWKPAMRRRAISAHEALLRHPWAPSLMQSRTRPGPSTLKHHDAVLGSLRNAGFTLVMAAHAVSLIDGYIYGFALQQINIPLQSREQVAEVGESILRQMAGEYPHLAEMITKHAMLPGYDYAEEFEFGLDLILDGLERLRDAG
ncbi:MAG TPA: TetR/AcrR family transcriptional regulator C-terminal domain-containing protein [Candidatus Dormibacteraeota bacterium]|jgi:AcrR family transcriptional regulator|nr:TetR/AcrR family transcriptional regulator C-terminal domain-containing protein [Candidatus Dormibacteraeota bacterium]